MNEPATYPYQKKIDIRLNSQNIIIIMRTLTKFLKNIN